MSRVLVAVVSVLLFSLPSFGISFPGAVGVIGTDLQDRIDEIAGLASPTPAELKESGALGKALDALGKYGGGTGKKDLGVVAKVLGTVFKTGTPDADLNTSCASVLDIYDGMAVDERDRAEELRSHIAGAAGQAKVTAAIDKAEAVRAAANVETDWGKAAKGFMKANAAFAKATATAGKTIEKEIASGPVLTCSFPDAPGFSADSDTIASTLFNPAILIVVGTMPGDPGYGVLVVIDTPPGPGTYPIDTGHTYVWRGEMGAGETRFYATSGSMVLDVFTEHAVSGTFSFATDGPFDVTSGVFRSQLWR